VTFPGEAGKVKAGVAGTTGDATTGRGIISETIPFGVLIHAFP
jgi:hypothetical protein